MRCDKHGCELTPLFTSQFCARCDEEAKYDQSVAGIRAKEEARLRWLDAERRARSALDTVCGGTDMSSDDVSPEAMSWLIKRIYEHQPVGCGDAHPWTLMQETLVDLNATAAYLKADAWSDACDRAKAGFDAAAFGTDANGSPVVQSEFGVGSRVILADGVFGSGQHGVVQQLREVDDGGDARRYYALVKLDRGWRSEFCAQSVEALRKMLLSE